MGKFSGMVLFGLCLGIGLVFVYATKTKPPTTDDKGTLAHDNSSSMEKEYEISLTNGMGRGTLKANVWTKVLFNEEIGDGEYSQTVASKTAYVELMNDDEIIVPASEKLAFLDSRDTYIYVRSNEETKIFIHLKKKRL